MAVEITGSYVLYQGSDEAGSISVTVPSDADICIVTCSGEPGAHFSDELCWDDGTTNDFTIIAYSSVWATHNCSAWYMVSTDANWPGSGAKTLYFDHLGGATEGRNVIVFFLKGVDTSDPIVDTDKEDAPQSSWTSSMSGVGADDLGIITVYSYQSNEPVTLNLSPSGSGQTELVITSLYQRCIGGVGYELGEDELQCSGNTIAPVAFAIKASAAGPAVLPIYKKRLNTLLRL